MNSEEDEIKQYLDKLLENCTIEDIKYEGMEETEDKIIFNVTVKYNQPVKYITLNTSIKPLSGDIEEI